MININNSSTRHDVPVRFEFTSWECGGRMLDLETFYENFCNLQFYKNILTAEALMHASQKTSTSDIKNEGTEEIISTSSIRPANILTPLSTFSENPLTYLHYLAIFEDMSTTFSFQTKLKASSSALQEYSNYLTTLLAYLEAFYCKIQPLVPTSGLVQIMKKNFEESWNAKNVVGWFPDAKLQRVSKIIEGLSYPLPDIFTRHQNMVLVDDGCLSEESLASNPLYCVVCEKLFAKQPMFDQHLNGKKHLRALETTKTATTTENTVKEDSVTKMKHGNGNSTIGMLKDIALMEYMLVAWADLLRPQINETRLFQEKKQTKSQKEMLSELEALQDAEVYFKNAEKKETADEEKLRAKRLNPHNVPLGPDGNPIPYWLYKLHGLNIYYTCEICGNTKYRGERAFYKHFREWRHTHYLKCLGIPNTEHFTNITKIQEALDLYAKLQSTLATTQFQTDKQEEVEDILGNVYKKADYLRLKEKGDII